ncbi:MAG TPA: methyltransferase domain-containing protein [Candidatus Atribacteria bacterium]|nr:methyltransferase domain-containing protein [Candidatus Atribacteria bacterium]
MSKKDLYELKFYIEEPLLEEIENLLIIQGFTTDYFTEKEKDKIKFAVYGKREKIKNLNNILKEKGITVEINDKIVLWKENEILKPYKVIDDVIINPNLNEGIRIKEDKKIVITLIPGIAFGTGRHESTKLAVKLILSLNLKGKRVIDIGCGSGILSVLSKKLGAIYVKALDKEPQAIEKTKETASLNNVNIDIQISDLLENVTGRYDLVIANIVPEILKKLLPQLDKVITKDSKVIFSGIYEDSYQIMKSTILKYNYIIEKELILNGWHSFLFKKN